MEEYTHLANENTFSVLQFQNLFRHSTNVAETGSGYVGIAAVKYRRTSFSGKER